LRDVILYEDILKNQKRILIYDTKGVQYKQVCLLVLGFIAGGSLFFYLVEKSKMKNLNIKVELDYTPPGKFVQNCLRCAFVVSLYAILVKYRRVQRLTIEKIVYDTEKEQFEFYKRNWYGSVSKQLVSKDKLMYTENEKMWKKGINYYHLDTM
jgi:hypothetical protein